MTGATGAPNNLVFLIKKPNVIDASASMLQIDASAVAQLRA